jgi:hypothetical protein
VQKSSFTKRLHSMRCEHDHTWHARAGTLILGMRDVCRVTPVAVR